MERFGIDAFKEAVLSE